MSKYYLGPFLIIATVVAIWIFAVFRDRDRSEIIPNLAGCYQNEGGNLKLVLLKTGELRSHVGNTKVRVTQDKDGLSLLPESKLMIASNSDESVLITNGYPFLLRISKDRLSIVVPREAGPNVRFSKILG